MTGPAGTADRWPTQQCSSDACRAPVIWARTERGKTMPIDAEPSPAGTVLLEATADPRQPRAKVVPIAQRDEHRGQLHTSHFATCPRAGQFRRSQR